MCSDVGQFMFITKAPAQGTGKSDLFVTRQAEQTTAFQATITKPAVMLLKDWWCAIREHARVVLSPWSHEQPPWSFNRLKQIWFTPGDFGLDVSCQSTQRWFPGAVKLQTVPWALQREMERSVNNEEARNFALLSHPHSLLAHFCGLP